MKNIQPSQIAIDEFYKLFYKEYLNKNIEINIYKESDNLIELNEIWSEKNIGEGYASKTLTLLTNTCMKYKVDIYLKVLPLRYTPSPYMDNNLGLSDRNNKFLSKEILQKWYERNGFKIIDQKKFIMKKKGIT
jgi:hypothetical protein